MNLNNQYSHEDLNISVNTSNNYSSNLINIKFEEYTKELLFNISLNTSNNYSSNLINIKKYTKEDYNNLRKQHMNLLSEEERQRQEVEIELANKGIMKSVKEKLVIIRAKRDELLAKTDYMFTVPDVIITDKVIKYRQELRDFPNKIVNGIYDNHIHILAIPDNEIISYLPKLE
jgi:hypothetical protein